jgi:hypothetical protein
MARSECENERTTHADAWPRNDDGMPRAHGVLIQALSSTTHLFRDDEHFEEACVFLQLA